MNKCNRPFVYNKFYGNTYPRFVICSELVDQKLRCKNRFTKLFKSVLFTPQLAIICLASLLTFNFLNNLCFFRIFLPLPRYRRLDYFIVQTRRLKDNGLPKTWTPQKIVLPKANGYYHPLAISSPGYWIP